MFAAVTFYACDDDENEDIIDPGPEMSYWVDVVLDGNLRNQYNVARLFAMEYPNPKTKIGQSAGPLGVDGARFKITMPKSYTNSHVTLVTELQLIKSGFDNPTAIEEKFARMGYDLPGGIFDFITRYPIAINMLKSRYTFNDNIILPGSSWEMNISMTSDLKAGYSPGSYKLSDISGLPNIYLLNVDSLKAEVLGFELVGIIATAAGALNTDTLVGIALPEVDWALIMQDSKPPNPPLPDPVKLWLIYTAPNGHACPCMAKSPPVCNCSSCPYTYVSSVIPVTDADRGPPSRDGISLPGVTGEMVTTPIESDQSLDFPNKMDINVPNGSGGTMTVTLSCP
ncbi:hypothetical protein AGMMS50212_07200 [Spirochaetia bacterium]|nr:hypothetical protein AGMMS50212_07200 [Spirochaetia bacterium]